MSSSFYFLIFFLFFCTSIIAMPSRADHEDRNRYNKLPVGNLRQQNNDNVFVDSAGTLWIQRPFIMSLSHHPTKNYVFESYDKSSPSSSEAVAQKSLFDQGKQVFTNGSFNFHSPYHNPVLHFFIDMMPSFFYG